MTQVPGEVTLLLQPVREGAPGAGDALFARLYDELQKIAGGAFRAQRASHTLQPTALVHEVYLKLLGSDGAPVIHDRAHVLCLASRAMRQVLVNHARDKNALRALDV